MFRLVKVTDYDGLAQHINVFKIVRIKPASGGSCYVFFEDGVRLRIKESAKTLSDRLNNV